MTLIHCSDGNWSLLHARGKVILEQLPCEQFLQAFEIYRALLPAKQVREKRAKIPKT